LSYKIVINFHIFVIFADMLIFALYFIILPIFARFAKKSFHFLAKMLDFALNL